MIRMAKILSATRSAALSLLVLSAGMIGPARADGVADAATTVIDALDHALLDVMKNATKLGYQGRYDTLKPVLLRSYDLPRMTQLVVGPAWTGWSEADRSQVTDAFTRFVIATYARRFDGYSGENFVIDGERQSPNGAIVLTHLTRPKDPSITINYLMRDNGAAGPQVIDVYLTGTISQLAQFRSEFSAILAHEGINGLIAALEKKAENPGK
jgi:phospholipid transport system substrate-binding protein